MWGGQSRAPRTWIHSTMPRAAGTGGLADGRGRFRSSAVPVQWWVAVELLYCALAFISKNK